MAGFFTVGQLQKEATAEVDVENLTPDCLRCKRKKNCKSPMMELSGEGRKKILIIGGSPSYQDDNNMIQFSGDTGKYLRTVLRANGINLNLDCWKLNAVNCYAEGGVDQKHITCCRPYVEKHIYQLKPDLIILLGSQAITSLFGEDFSNRTEDRWRDLILHDNKYNCKIFCTYHPAKVKIDSFNINLKTVFERDIAHAVAALKVKHKDSVDFEQHISIVTDFNKLTKLLNTVLETKKIIYFDYETTGLKPYRNGHAIAVIGFALSATEGYVFPFKYKDHWTEKEFKQIKDLWYQILKKKTIKKIAHNIKFEDNWSALHIGTRPIGWTWDTLMGAHISDNRKVFSGLKFQLYVNYGLRPYDKHISHYLEAVKGTEFNRIYEAPFKDLLIYCGIDCVGGFQLYEDQKAFYANKKGLANANSFFTHGLVAMAEIQLNGIHMDEEYYATQRKELFVKIRKLKKELVNGREGRAFYKMFNRKMNVTSDQDVGKLLYEVLGKSPRYTGTVNKKTGQYNYKTDKETISKLKVPWVDKLLEMKRLEKARGTYLAQFAREVFDGYMHPFFDLHIPVSYRSSSSKPNFQNLPKRDKEIKKLVRRGIIPRDNCVLVEADFSGAEVITSVCYHKDRNFFNYLMDKSTDMHRDNACDLLQVDVSVLNNPEYTREEMLRAKDIRSDVKNSWTFPQFYGDWYEACAKYMWEKWSDGKRLMPNGQPVIQYLQDIGIYELEDFAEHCKVCEDIMWNERFPEYTQWKKDIVKFYRKYGYIETYFGFRFTGLMDNKQCTNFPIQGTSFHLLVYTLILVAKFIKKHKLRTKLIGQIHDSIIADCPLDEVAFYTNGVAKIVKGLQERFKWLIVPMEIEAEISKPKEFSGSFTEMFEIKPDVMLNFDFKKIYKDNLTDDQYNLLFKKAA